MTYESFCDLHDKLKDGIAKAVDSKKRQPPTTTKAVNRARCNPPIPNGQRIETSVRLGCALRYFAGGSPYDLQVKYGISHTAVIDSVWNVVDAINTNKDFFIPYPTDHNEQCRMAAEWKAVSGVTLIVVPALLMVY